MKIQPLDTDSYGDTSAKPVVKSRLKRLFDRQFRVSSSEKAELEPSSVGLDKMVQNFIEDSSEKQKLSRSRCGCFNGNNYGSSDDEFDELDDYVVISSSIAWSDNLKELIQCGSKSERDLLADTSMIVDKNKTCKRKDDLNQIVTVGLALLGYDASICKSRWEKSPSVPAGDYEYIDVIVEGGKERVIIDVDFSSEFEIARSTSSYKWILQSLPHIYVGGPDRLHQIVSIVSEAAKQSLKKKGMHIPPWRKAEYMRAKWLSPHTRVTTHGGTTDADEEEFHVQALKTVELRMDSECDDFVLIFCKEAASSVDVSTTTGVTWQPPEIKPRSCEGNGSKVVTGLACLLREKP